MNYFFIGHYNKRSGENTHNKSVIYVIMTIKVLYGYEPGVFFSFFFFAATAVATPTPLRGRKLRKLKIEKKKRILVNNKNNNKNICTITSSSWGWPAATNYNEWGVRV